MVLFLDSRLLTSHFPRSMEVLWLCTHLPQLVPHPHLTKTWHGKKMWSNKEPPDLDMNRKQLEVLAFVWKLPFLHKPLCWQCPSLLPPIRNHFMFNGNTHWDLIECGSLWRQSMEQLPSISLPFCTWSKILTCHKTSWKTIIGHLEPSFACPLIHAQRF